MESIVQIGCGEYMVYYVTDAGNVYCYVNRVLIKLPFTSPIIQATGGLHIGAALDKNGYVWTMGANNVGQQGSGGISSGSDSVPYKVIEDISGNVFNNVISIQEYMGSNIAVKADGTVWFWGEDNLNLYGGNVLLPRQMAFPTGVKITKLVHAYPILALDSTGTVWQWGYGNTTPTKVTLPGLATDIAGCQGRVLYAIINGYPYGWGGDCVYMGLLGYQGSYYNPVSTPTPLKDVWGLKAPISSIVASDNTTHFIDTNGDLWGMGDNVMGEVGNGKEIDWATYKNSSGQITPYTYSWDWSKYELMILKPIQILPGTKFKIITTGQSFAFFNYAQDAAGNWYSWGRNKGLVLGNGLTINEDAAMPNLIDVPLPTIVTPLTTPVKVLTLAQTGKPFATPTTSTSTSTSTTKGTTTSTSTTSTTTRTTTTSSTTTSTTTYTTTTSSTTTTTTTKSPYIILYADGTWVKQ